MKNLSRIKRFSKTFHQLLSLLLVAIPLYYVLYWVFINDLPTQLISVNTPSVPLIPYDLGLQMRALGFLASLLPQAALLYGLWHLRKLFGFYREGVIFSFAHVRIFKSTSKALLLWVLFSMVYESAKSILFSLGAGPGNRVVSIGFTSSEMTTLMVGGMVWVIARVMDEGRILTEENELTV